MLSLVYDQDYAVQYWITGGFPSHKINLGIPLYAQSWAFSGANTPGSAATGPAPAGVVTDQSGVLSYLEVVVCTRTQYLSLLCQYMKVNHSLQLCLDSNYGTNEVWDGERWAPYSWSGGVWVSYDNEQSIQAKVCCHRFVYVTASLLPPTTQPPKREKKQKKTRNNRTKRKPKTE